MTDTPRNEAIPSTSERKFREKANSARLKNCMSSLAQITMKIFGWLFLENYSFKKIAPTRATHL